MGSGYKRKDNDQLIIRRPMKISFSGAEISGDKGGIVADTCLPSFDQRVEKNSLTQPGITVRLQKENAGYKIYIGENPIGKLNAKYSGMVSKCSSLGVKYLGKIVIKKSNPYARFVRVSR